MEQGATDNNNEVLSTGALQSDNTSDRPLATIQRVEDLQPIQGADVIEVATILGWKVVVKKGLHAIGNYVAYAEIDSILPPWQYFIHDKLDKAKFRIKTIKLRGQISQGYCIPLKVLEQHPEKKLKVIVPEEKITDQTPPLLVDVETNTETPLILGRDVTQIIGIKKYEIPDTGVNIGGQQAGLWPTFMKKTDQTRIQSLPKYPIIHADVEFEVTEKLEGTSITSFWFSSRFGICSRNYELKYLDNNDSLAVKVLTEMKIKEKLDNYAKNIALQGELIGPGIQGNIYKLKDHNWMIFDIYLIDEQRYATHTERKEILKAIGMEKNFAPVLEIRKIGGMNVEDILKMAEGKSHLNKNTNREGIVFKSTSLIEGATISFKAISNSYLLKQEAAK